MNTQEVRVITYTDTSGPFFPQPLGSSGFESPCAPHNSNLGCLYAGQPLPSPSKQTVFPMRGGHAAHNERFVHGCFSHLPHERAQTLRIILRKVLQTPWWQGQLNGGVGELDYFGERRPGKGFECQFCATHFPTVSKVKGCIKKHIQYQPA